MGYKIATGISVTRAALTSPDSTFIWDVKPEPDGSLEVIIKYGGETATIRKGTASIPSGSTVPVSIQHDSDPYVFPEGTVCATWSNDNQSYIVTFSGQMVRPGMNNIISSDKNGALKESNSIIVYAHLAD